MKKNLKRSVAWILSLMMVITMCSAAFSVAAEDTTVPSVSVMLDCEEGEPSVNVLGARTAPTFAYEAGKGVNGSAALAVTKNGDGQYNDESVGRIDNCFILVDGKDVVVGDAQYLMVWMDLSAGIDFRSASFGFETADGTRYDSDNLDGRTDSPLYMLADGSDEWVTKNLYDDGCFGTAQLCSVANFRGWVALPLDVIVAGDGSTVSADATVNKLYMYFDLADIAMEGTTFYLDHACFVEDYKTAFGSTDTPEEIPDWAFVEWTEADQAITHLGLSTATPSDGNWSNYRYVGCQFVPYKNSISGVKIPMNLTSDDATMHIEVRSEINGTALYSGDIDFTSQGDGRNVYTFDFGTNVAVTPGETYYMVWWLTDRNPGSVCIAYGTDVGVGKDVTYGLVWTMSQGDGTGANPEFTVHDNVVFSFELIDTVVEESNLPTEAVILDCETGDTPDTYIYKARTAPTFEYVDGKGVNGSRALAITKTGDGQYDNPENGRIDNCMMYVYGDSVNIGSAKYFMIWMDLSAGIDFRSASLGFSTPDGYGYDPDNNDGRDDLPLYMLPEGASSWVNSNLYLDGCFGTSQYCSVANFRGWLAMPLDIMLADEDCSSTVPADTVIDTLYMFFDFDSLEMEGKTFYIDHACFVDDYKTAVALPESPEEPEEVPDWAFVEWTNRDEAITHLGLSTATRQDGDPNWTNYRYVGCRFIPYKNSVSGVKIPMNLTSDDATMHIEIRREINGTALYSGDIDFTSQGDGRFVYTFDFGKDVMVTPGDTYYMVWWLSDRNPGSVCIAYGTDVGVGSDKLTGVMWTMNDGDGTGANPEFSVHNHVVFSFELIDADVEGPATYIQWNSFDKGGVSHEAGKTENAAHVNEGQLEGSAAYSVTGKPDNASNGELFFYLHPDTAYPERPTVDMSNAAYITFDMYCGEEIVSSNILDAGFNVSNSDSWDAGGRACSAATLKGMTWKQGWNHVIIPIDRSLLSESFDETALKRGRFYIIYNGSFAGVTFMIDDLCLIAESDLATCQGRNAAKDVIAAINALPAVDAISFEDGKAIKAALEAFNALEPVYQEMVTNRNTLATVNSAYDTLAAAAIAVQEQIDALPKVAGSSEIFVEDVAAVRMAYTVLPEEKKGFVSNIDVLVNIEKQLQELQESKVATITAKDMAENVASFGTSYGEMLGWKIDPGQSNNWIIFNLNHTYGPGEYKLGVKIRYTGLTDSRPAISIKCSDNTTGEDEKFKRDCGQADYDAAEKDENGFVYLWLDVNVTEDIASHTLEGKVLAYNEFFENMEIIIAGVYWVNANDTELIYDSVEMDEFALSSTAKILDGTIVYNDASPIRIEYEQDDTKDVTDEPGYIFPALSAGNLTAGDYMLDLAYASTSGNDNLFELEVYAGGSKVASRIVNEKDYVGSAKNSDDIAYLQIPFSLSAASDVTVKVYQMNGGNVSYRTIKIYKTGEGVDIPGDPVQDVIDAINALPEASAVSEADRAAIMAAKAAYDALTDEQKAFVSNFAKLNACIEALPDVSVTMGDVDGDGEINAADALLILKQAVGKIQLSDAQKTAADVTRDGTINAEDALKVLKFAVGKITEL